jgi:SAM-dependent methyltransferase
MNQNATISILDRFPKKRIELPTAYKTIYTQHYLVNREGGSKTTSLSRKLERWLHKKVSKDVVKSVTPKSTLEIGAGTLNQLDFEPNQKVYDIIEPFSELFEGSPKSDRITNIYSDISEVQSRTYDRITSVAVFEHIIDLPRVVAKAALLLNPGGCLRTSIPNEGNIMWALGTKITGYEFKQKYGLDYKTFMDYEHVNTAVEIEAVLDYFFDKTETASFGLGKNLAFYRFFVHENPNIDLAIEYLTARET